MCNRTHPLKKWKIDSSLESISVPKRVLYPDVLKNKSLVENSQLKVNWHLRNHVVNLHLKKKVNSLLKVIQGHPGLSGRFKRSSPQLSISSAFFAQRLWKHLKLKQIIYRQFEIMRISLKSSNFKLFANWESTWLICIIMSNQHGGSRD